MVFDDDTASELDDFPQPSPKRRRLAENDDAATETDALLDVLQKPISPPQLRRSQKGEQVNRVIKTVKTHFVSAPIELTRIHDLSLSENVDTISLEDILNDPLIKKTWQFNFLFDINFLMYGCSPSSLDRDVRDLVEVNVVHGFWKKDDPSRANLLAAAGAYSNVKLITAHMPEIFGTHHSKMMINLRHDDTAQVIIHTANMIERDWANLTQAVWKSPLLPMLPEATESSRLNGVETLGIGERFKIDLLQYLGAYEGRTTSLVTELERHDFSSVRAALIASVPGRHTRTLAPSTIARTSWGLQGLREILKRIPSSTAPKQRSKVVVQVSSIASLRPLEAWFDEFRNVLSTTSDVIKAQPIFRIIFPTADEVRRSLDGYGAGASIHTKLQGAAQRKQLDYLRPMLCYWAGDMETPTDNPMRILEAGRRRAAPHIKTYIRYADTDMTRIDWAMVTSANLSLQAWGALPDKDGKVRISSYEIGVVVWPGLFADNDDDDDDDGQPAEHNTIISTPQFPERHHGSASAHEPIPTSTLIPSKKGRTVMVPTFKKNTPAPLNQETIPANDVATVVGFRMPYDVPLTRYTAEEKPWCASSNYRELDWRGEVWVHEE